MLTVYFGLKNGSMITNRELVNIAYICDGLTIDPEDKEAVLDYAERCKSVKGVINRPSVKYLVLHGYRVRAIKLYYETHKQKGVTIIEAKERVDALESEWRKKK